MTYETRERAEQVADELNQRYGFPQSRAVLSEHGWTVVGSYEYGVTQPRGR